MAMKCSTKITVQCHGRRVYYENRCTVSRTTDIPEAGEDKVAAVARTHSHVMRYNPPRDISVKRKYKNIESGEVRTEMFIMLSGAIDET